MSQLTELRDRLDALHRATGWNTNTTDEYMSEMLHQLIALEEIVAARWPRSVLLRARWRRDVRASMREMEGSTWAWRRLNAISTDWLSRDGAFLPGPQHRAA